MVDEPEIPLGMVGRLLESVSWEKATWYRRGGRGRENVLTLEVLQALDLLPRAAFLGRILATKTHGATVRMGTLARECEAIDVTLLPLDLYLDSQAADRAPAVSVQPDAVLESPSGYCLLEAKRIKAGSFQYDQLAKELVTAWTHGEARGKEPSLLLVLPPLPAARFPVQPERASDRLVHVKQPDNHARWVTIAEAIAAPLNDVLARGGPGLPGADAVVDMIDATVAYVTWDEISDAVGQSAATFEAGDPSVRASIIRLADALQRAIERAR